MGYSWHLIIGEKHHRLLLRQAERTITMREWTDQRDLGQKVFQALTDMFAEQKLHPEQVSEFFVESFLPDTYTSSRIAETLKRVYIFGTVALTNVNGNGTSL